MPGSKVNSLTPLSWHDAAQGAGEPRDPLTGLPCRRAFVRVVDAAITVAREEGRRHTLCFLDLDRMRVINDVCCHEAGDRLLTEVVELIRAALGAEAPVARLSGDEFALLLPDVPLRQGRATVRALQSAITEYRFSCQGKVFDISVTVGLAEINSTSQHAGELLSAVDSACYEAKSHGSNQLHVFDVGNEDEARRRRRMEWLHRLRWALDHNALVMFAQEIRPLHGQRSRHYEVLVRLHGADGRLVAPGEFIPVAEQFGLMADVDAWVVENSLKVLRSWEEFHDFGPGQAPHLSLNLSAQSLSEKRFLERIIRLVDESGISPRRIHFEITETAAVTCKDNALRFIRALRELGCRFMLDDFGSGLSSFAYLKDLPVDAIKIDGIFVRGLESNPAQIDLLKAINDIGKTMGLETVAEFVESEEIEAFLAEIGVDYAQGYGIARPQPLEEVLAEHAAASIV